MGLKVSGTKSELLQRLKEAGVGQSVFGGFFEDEDFTLRHDRRGVLSMANSGPNTNGCQFLITASAAPDLDGKHVVFGRVIDGYDKVIPALQRCGSPSGAVSCDVVIQDCGVLPESLQTHAEIKRETDLS